MNKKAIGVDIGGTAIKIGLVDEGIIIYEDKALTEADKGFEHSLKNVKNLIHKVIKENNLTTEDISGIGFGFPGIIDYDKGILKKAVNLIGWDNSNVKEIFEKEFNLPIKLDNDANCAALGEFYYGAGMNCKDVVCITLGTGIGAGIIANGQIIRGFNGTAGELGHIKLQREDGPVCGCGDYGCFEAFASASAVTRIIKEKGVKAENSYDLFCLAQKGDEQALEIFKIVGEHIGYGLCYIVNLLNPQKIVIGGGMAKAGNFLFEHTKDILSKRTFEPARDGLEIVSAKLGNSAGIIGAASL